MVTNVNCKQPLAIMEQSDNENTFTESLQFSDEIVKAAILREDIDFLEHLNSWEDPYGFNPNLEEDGAFYPPNFISPATFALEHKKEKVIKFFQENGILPAAEPKEKTVNKIDLTAYIQSASATSDAAPNNHSTKSAKEKPSGAQIQPESRNKPR